MLNPLKKKDHDVEHSSEQRKEEENNGGIWLRREVIQVKQSSI